ncbi:MAG: DUF2461 domain-containing protein [Ignavibacteriae bacterium]|nr:DUF2461 domain-containing protein [Ignavibacteriota bacterium]
MLDILIKEPFLGFTEESLGFLKKLENKKFNNKDWFDKNRDVYEQFIKHPMRTLIDTLAGELYKVDPDIVVNYKSIFRINRDVRFSKNKEPYKNMTSASFCFGTIKKPELPQFYFHLSPSEFLFAAGQYSTDPGYLKKIKNRIYSDFDRFKKIISDKKLVFELGSICGDKLSNFPRGFPGIPKENSLLAELLKMKQYYFYKSYKPGVALNPDVVNLIVDNIKISYDFTKFLNDSVK